MVDLTAADLKVALNIDRIESEEGKGSYDVEWHISGLCFIRSFCSSEEESASICT